MRKFLLLALLTTLVSPLSAAVMLERIDQNAAPHPLMLNIQATPQLQKALDMYSRVIAHLGPQEGLKLIEKGAVPLALPQSGEALNIFAPAGMAALAMAARPSLIEQLPTNMHETAPDWQALSKELNAKAIKSPEMWRPIAEKARNMDFEPNESLESLSRKLWSLFDNGSSKGAAHDPKIEAVSQALSKEELGRFVSHKFSSDGTYALTLAVDKTGQSRARLWKRDDSGLYRSLTLYRPLKKTDWEVGRSNEVLSIEARIDGSIDYKIRGPFSYEGKDVPLDLGGTITPEMLSPELN